PSGSGAAARTAPVTGGSLLRHVRRTDRFRRCLAGERGLLQRRVFAGGQSTCIAVEREPHGSRSFTFWGARCEGSSCGAHRTSGSPPTYPVGHLPAARSGASCRVRVSTAP